MEKNYNTVTKFQTLSLDEAIEKINTMLSTEISRINIHAYNTFIDIAKQTVKLSKTKTVAIGEGIEISNYENAFNLTNSTFYNNHISTINTPFILTDKYNYALGRNGIYKYFSQTNATQNNSDIYSYYDFNKDGNYERYFVNKKDGLLKASDSKQKLFEYGHINTVTEMKTAASKIDIDANYQYETADLIEKICNPSIYKAEMYSQEGANTYMGMITDKGIIRDNNEDNMIILAKPGVNPNDEFKLLAVADGMGGFKDGELASFKTIASLEEWFASKPVTDFYLPSKLAADLEEEIIKINKSVMTTSKNPLGTTLTCAIVGPTQTIIANVGDSRCYALKDLELKQLTEDDSKAYDLYKMAYLTKEDIRYYKDNHIITQAIGVTNNVEAQIQVIDNSEYDTLLLLTDGVTDCLSDEKIKVIANTTRTNEILDKIIEEAVYTPQPMSTGITLPKSEIYYPAPGKDNTTAVIYTKKIN